MSKTLSRLIASFLVPCLLADPMIASAFQQPLSNSSAVNRQEFSCEAFAPRAIQSHHFLADTAPRSATLRLESTGRATQHHSYSNFFSLRPTWKNVITIVVGIVFFVAGARLGAQVASRVGAANSFASPGLAGAPGGVGHEIQRVADIENTLEDRMVAINRLAELPSNNAASVISTLGAIAQNPYDAGELRMRAVHVLDPLLRAIPRQQGADLCGLDGAMRDIYIQSGVMIYGQLPVPFITAVKQFTLEARPELLQNVHGVLALDEETYRSLFPPSTGGFVDGVLVTGVSQGVQRSGFKSHRVGAGLENPSHFVRHEFGHAGRKAEVSDADWEKLNASYAGGRMELGQAISAFAELDSEEAFAEVFAAWFERSDELFRNRAIDQSETARLFIEVDAQLFVFERNGKLFISLYVPSVHDGQISVKEEDVGVSSKRPTYSELNRLYASVAPHAAAAQTLAARPEESRQAPLQPAPWPGLQFLPFGWLAAFSQRPKKAKGSRSDSVLPEINESLARLNAETPHAVILAALRPSGLELSTSSKPNLLIIHNYEAPDKLEKAQRTLIRRLQTLGLYDGSVHSIIEPLWLHLPTIRQSFEDISEAMRSGQGSPELAQKIRDVRLGSLALHHFLILFRDLAVMRMLPKIPHIPGVAQTAESEKRTAGRHAATLRAAYRLWRAA